MKNQYCSQLNKDGKHKQSIKKNIGFKQQINKLKEKLQSK